MPLFQKQKNRVANPCKRKCFSFFYFLKKRHNNIEKIELLENGGDRLSIV